MIKQDLLENQVKPIYLAIGSNLGNRTQNIEKAKFQLLQSDLVINKSSSNYESLSWPNPSNPKFINAIVEIHTKVSPLKLLYICNSIERKLGRKKTRKNDPRPCDIDIIDYKQKLLNLDNDKLITPHPRMISRNFVLLPLFEVNKSWKHPKSAKNIVNLLKDMTIENLRTIKQL